MVVFMPHAMPIMYMGFRLEVSLVFAYCKLLLNIPGYYYGKL